MELSNKLLRAASNGKLEKVKHLIEKCGADIETQTQFLFWTPLYLASMWGHLPVVEYLVGAGANIEAVSKLQWTPLHEAVRNESSLPVVQFLISKGANINHVDQDGWSCLHKSATRSSELMIKYLLDNGVDCLARTIKGETALDIAKECKNNEIVHSILYENEHLAIVALRSKVSAQKELVGGEDGEKELVGGENGQKKVVDGKDDEKELVGGEDSQKEVVNGENSQEVVDCKDAQEEVVDCENGQEEVVDCENGQEEVVDCDDGEKEPWDW